MSVVSAAGLGILFLGLGAYLLCASLRLSSALDTLTATSASSSSSVKSNKVITNVSSRVRRTGGIIAAALSLQACA